MTSKHVEDTPLTPTAGVTAVLARTKQKPWIFDRQLRKLYAVLIPACLFVCATNGYDGSMINGIQAVTSWQESFHYPSGAILGMMAASYPLGAICSTPFSAPIADMFGRRWAILIGSIIMCIGVALQTCSNSIAWFVGSRIVVGFGITLALAPGPVLISELAHPKDRVVFTAVYATSFYLGAIGAAWVTYGSFRIPSSWGWRLPSLLQAVPAIIQGALVMFLPESPRWLIYKDRAEEALAILVKYHGNGNPEDELVQAEYFEIVETLRLEKETRSKGIKLFFETKGNRRRLLILLSVGMFGQWSGNGLVSYYLAKILKSIGITDPSQQNMINGVVTIVNYVTGLTSAYIMGRVKRRYTFVIGGMFMWITFTGLTTCIAVYNEKAFASAGRAALGMIFISNTAYNLCLNPALYLYPSEILPYRLRAMGMSVVVFANKTALMFNQFVNPIGMDSLGWKFYLVYVVWILVEVLFMYFVYPETHGYSLESLAEIFDGPSIDTLAHEAFKRAEAEDKAGAAVESVETKLD